MAKIFISYRREDSRHFSGRICDRLGDCFGPENVLIDVDDIPAGADFPSHIERMIHSSAVMLLVIGDRWLELLHECANKGKGDFVRMELDAAFSLAIPIIPLLIDGAAMPTEQQLEPSLRHISRRQSFVVRSGRDFRDILIA